MSSSANPYLVGLNTVGSVLSGWAGRRRDQWNEGALINSWNRFNQGEQQGMDLYGLYADPLRDMYLQPGNQLGQYLTNWADPMFLQGEQLYRSYPEMFQNAAGMYATPQMDYYGQQFGGLAQGMGQFSDLAGQGFAGGGWTPQYQQAFDQFSPYMSGMGSNAQLALGDVGPNLIGQRGQTAYTQGIQDRAMDAANNGGRSPELNAALQMALQTLGGGGYTPSIQGMSNAGFGILQNGGQTDAGRFGQGIAGLGLANDGANVYTSALQDRGLDLLMREALMSPDQAANFAREDANRAISDEARKVYRQANQRGGGPGALTASGQENQMRADFADQAARLRSEGVQKALLNQQGLMQQQQQIGAGAMGTGGGLEASRLGQYGSLMTGLEGAANQRLGIGGQLMSGAESAAAERMGQAYSAIPGTSNAATSYLSALLSGGAQAGDLENARMGTGANMSLGLLGNQLGYGNLYNSTMGNQNQYALGLGGLYNNMMGTQGNLNNMGFQNYLGQAQLGVQGAQGMANAMNQGYGNWTNSYGQVGNTWGQATQGLGNMAGNALNYAGRYVDAMQAPFRNIQLTNAWAPLAGIGSNTGG